MKKASIVLSVCALAFLLGSLSTQVRSEAEGDWLTSHEKAVEMSKATGKPILMDFTGSDWCVWCIRLKKEVFNQPEFKSWADDNVILLELDFPQRVEQSEQLKAQNEALAKKYSIEGFPTVLIVNAEGEELARAGYKPGGPKVWTEAVEELLKP